MNVTNDGSLANDQNECSSETWRVILGIHSAFLIIFGFFANLCSFIVLIRPRLRRRPTFSYLAFLSLSNALLSLIYATFGVLAVRFDKIVEDLPLFLFCRLLNRFGIDFLTHFSLYTLTAVDIDRITTVTSRTSTNQRYGRTSGDRSRGCPRAFFHVCLVELSLALILLLFNFHWLIAYGYVEADPSGAGNKTRCEIRLVTNETVLNVYEATYQKFLSSILPVIELVLFNILPFVISAVATMVILRHVSIKYKLLNPMNKRLNKSRRRMELHLSILLVSLNCVFILFNTPHNIFTVYVTKIQSQLQHQTNEEGNLCFISSLQKSFDLLQQCYFMSTFFLYILTNRRFREEFCELIRRNLLVSCGVSKSTRSSTSVSSRTRRHHHRHHHHSSRKEVENDNLLPDGKRKSPSLPVEMETRFSVTDCYSHDLYDNEDDEKTSVSKSNRSSEPKSNVNS